MRQIINKKIGTAWVAVLMLVFSSCSNADVLNGMLELRQQVETPDSKTAAILTESKTVREKILKIHPGALYYLASSYQNHGLVKEAAALYQEQLLSEYEAWKGPAFRGWIRCLQTMQAWTEIIERSPQLSQELFTFLLDASHAKSAALQEIHNSREVWQQAIIEAYSQLNQYPEARNFLINAKQSWGRDNVPDWLWLAQARLAMLIQVNVKSIWTEALVDELLPALFSVDAQAGHIDLALVTQAMLVGKKAEQSPSVEALIKLLEAKLDLSRGQASAAFDSYREFLLPRGKATADDLALAQRWQKGLLDLLDRYPGLPDSFFRDFYNAGRLSGHLTESVRVMEEIRTQIVDARPRLRDSAILPMLLEFKGRLLRAKGDHLASRIEFGRALRLAQVLESNGKFETANRKRIQWYLLKSWTDAVDDLGKANDFDTSGFIGQARLSDDASYFSDVLEKAVLLAGGRQHWHDVELLYRKLAPNMVPDLRSNCALFLARVSQLSGNSKTERNRFDRFSKEARDRSDSIYYRAMAMWIRGEMLDIQALLNSQNGTISFLKPQTEQSIRGSWALPVVEGFCDLGLYDSGMDYFWEYRKEIQATESVRIGRIFISNGRFRQGLRILESIRVRVGHPIDHNVLEDFYPRPYLESIQAVVNNSVLPEWLMFSLVRTESNFDNSANSSAGAQGLAQLMPATAKLVAKQLKIANPDLSDPAINLRIGATYLRQQYESSGFWPQSLAAYNAGMGRVRSWTKAGMNPDPILFAELIPFNESRNYVRRITESSLFYNWLYYGLEPSTVLTLIFRAL